MKGIALRGWVRELDRILRGDATRPSALRRGQVEVPAGGLSVVLVLLGAAYGACMGCFALFRPGGPAWLQLLAAALKVPALFFLTLLVTFPSLYVFNALVGSRLSLPSALRLLIAALGVLLALLASLGPIVAFFSVITTSYSFMVLLNVAVFAVSGFLGLGFLLQTLHRLSLAAPQPPGPTPPAGPEADAFEFVATEPAGALDRVDDQVLGRHVRTIFRCWVVLFGLVGAQMGWVLRPFIGDPGRPFTWFRPRDSNFFEAIFHALKDLAS
jgi:hypothetical protein